MTLSSRIAALTSASREIDAEIADLLGWDHSGYPRPDFELPGRWQREVPSTYPDYVDCPNYTANIMHVFDECERREWLTGHDGDRSGMIIEFNIWHPKTDMFAQAERTDRNITLAACEALLRAVENNPNDA